MDNEKKERGIEETFEGLEEILSRLENGDISLEDTFKYYETGMEMIKSCTEQLDMIEKQIRLLAEEEIEDEEL